MDLEKRFTREDIEKLKSLAGLTDLPKDIREVIKRGFMAYEYENKSLQEKCNIDPTTGLYTRTYFNENLEKEIARANRHQHSLSLVMADIDFFKKVNDTYGHVVGDDVLAGTGEVIKSSIREVDTPCRYGGEEFAIILPETDLESAVSFAERLRQKLEVNEFSYDKGNFNITGSFGVAEYLLSEPPKRLVQRADANLYAAKKRGRNNVYSGEIL